MKPMLVKGKARPVKVFHPWRFVDDHDSQWKAREASSEVDAEVT